MRLNWSTIDSSTQAYNRYSYVHNNPMAYTDPSGELAWWAVSLISSAASYLINAGLNNSWNPNQWSSGSVGFGIYQGVGGSYTTSLAGGGNFGGNFSLMAGAGNNGSFGYGFSTGPGMASYSPVQSRKLPGINMGFVNSSNEFRPMYYDFGAGIPYTPPGDGGMEIAAEGMVGGYDDMGNPITDLGQDLNANKLEEAGYLDGRGTGTLYGVRLNLDWQDPEYIFFGGFDKRVNPLKVERNVYLDDSNTPGFEFTDPQATNYYSDVKRANRLIDLHAGSLTPPIYNMVIIRWRPEIGSTIYHYGAFRLTGHPGFWTWKYDHIAMPWPDDF